MAMASSVHIEQRYGQEGNITIKTAYILCFIQLLLELMCKLELAEERFKRDIDR